ncbi:unnamed protein product [Heterosigma akashiwo]|uniref:threonine synthase n=1 Tax=Heterosigma akashiwo TaxID=2829 RepID=A0A6T5LU83_HETAK|mmetsp:Transcript_11119/g.15597  ORF Transcript_11119/g.15597 Transcript_11119/m.15597 type:complete len:524 (+) Transcript_11119:87-1658(+)
MAPTCYKYKSTRGGQKGVGFEETVMTGLARDKGLFVPEDVPFLGMEKIEQWRALPFADLAFEIMKCYISPAEIPHEDLKDLVYRSTVNFRSDEVTPVREVGPGAPFFLELFHGPTFAFKDVALQFLGNLFEYFLGRKPGAKLTIMGATSGDTGSAAIYGLRGKKNVNCFILFPTGKVSPIQERQMTTVPDANVHCVSLAGTFDDAQDIVKASFNDAAFREEVSIGAVNSINWARVLAQMSYFFYAYFRVTERCPGKDEVSFSVPTGNYGDILAGYYAKRMGLKVKQLVVATNENDILHRFFTTGKYHRRAFIETLAPSMDICVSSNFERYLFHLSGDDAATLAGWFAEFEKTGQLTVTGDLLAKAQSEFGSGSFRMEDNIKLIKQYWDEYRYALCPHTCVGAGVVHGRPLAANEAMVVLATASPGKFPAAVGKAIQPLPRPPVQLAVLDRMPTRKTELPNDARTVQDFVRATLRSSGVAPAGQGGAAAPPCQAGRGKGKVPSLVALGLGVGLGLLLSRKVFAR